MANAKGHLCGAQARKILAELAEELSIVLPAAAKRPDKGGCSRYEAVKLRCTLEDLGEVSVSPVSPQQTRQWHSMMHTHHPRGAPQLPGATIKYWVVSERHGVVGGLSFHTASWQQAARDTFIGWSARARTANIDKVLNNSRLLVLPSVEVHGLASETLRLARTRICDDWNDVYGVNPVFTYTYIDGEHTGGCYQAARWRRMGQTSGRRSDDAKPKQVYGIGLCANWQQQLQAVPAIRFHGCRDFYIKDAANWSDIEYVFSTHPDRRIRKRLLSMGQDWQNASQDPIPQIFANEAKSKAAYRFFSNKAVSVDDILESHRQATVARGALHGVGLAVQDTTSVNYDTMKNSTKGLVKIGGAAKGVMVHATVAFSEAGRPLGVLDIDGEFRRRFSEHKELTESQRWVEGFETAAEYSVACGTATRVISVYDREGDVWEAFEEQSQRSQQAGLLVRCNGSRQRKVIDAQGVKVDLRAHVESAPVVAKLTIFIEAQGGKRAREDRTANCRCGYHLLQ